MKIISIEGNIGSGKSTFLQLLKDNIKDDNVLFLGEPVDEWNSIKDTEGKNIIENYYSDQKKYAFSFQMMAYISRLAVLKRAIESKKYNIIITERCLYTDKNVFCNMLYDDGLIHLIDYTIYNKWFDEFLGLMTNIHYVYLKTDPLVSNKRVIHRARKGEVIDIKYLIKCGEYHDRWLDSSKNVTIIDANIDSKYLDIHLWINIVRELMIE